MYFSASGLIKISLLDFCISFVVGWRLWGFLSLAKFALASSTIKEGEKRALSYPILSYPILSSSILPIIRILRRSRYAALKVYIGSHGCFLLAARVALACLDRPTHFCSENVSLFLSLLLKLAEKRESTFFTRHFPLAVKMKTKPLYDKQAIHVLITLTYID